MITLYLPHDDIAFGMRTCVVLGNFDGVHLGHSSLICRAVKYAKKNKLLSVVYTFDRHPKNVVSGEAVVKSITSFEIKKEAIERLGVDFLIVQKIDIEFLNMEPEDFAKNYILKKLHARHVFAGKHYSFGKGSSASAEELVLMGKEYGFHTTIMPLMYQDDEVVGSRYIRDYLANGQIALANKRLGRCYEIAGKVEVGNRIGSTIGFPTVNIYPEKDWLLPKFGVYITRTRIDQDVYESVTNVGLKPTVDGKNPVIETHVFGQDNNMYGKRINVLFLKFLRGEEKFEGMEALKNKISTDVLEAKEYFAKNYLQSDEDVLL